MKALIINNTYEPIASLELNKLQGIVIEVFEAASKKKKSLDMKLTDDIENKLNLIYDFTVKKDDKNHTVQIRNIHVDNLNKKEKEQHAFNKIIEAKPDYVFISVWCFSRENYWNEFVSVKVAKRLKEKGINVTLYIDEPRAEDIKEVTTIPTIFVPNSVSLIERAFKIIGVYDELKEYLDSQSSTNEEKTSSSEKNQSKTKIKVLE